MHLMRILFQNPLTKTGNLYEATTLPDKAALTASSSLSITGSVGLAYPKPIDSKNHNKVSRAFLTCSILFSSPVVFTASANLGQPDQGTAESVDVFSIFLDGSPHENCVKLSTLHTVGALSANTL